MNCQDITHLFDASSAELSRAQREAVDRHIASCPDCREEWASWREIAALPVPATPAGLRSRIATALAAQARPPRRVFRPFVVGGIVLAGAAFAAAIYLQLTRGGVEPAAVIAASPEPAAITPEVAVTSPVSPTLSAPVAEEPASARGSDAKPAASSVALNPRRVVALMRPEAVADASAIALTQQCYDALVAELRTLGGVEVLTAPAGPTVRTGSYSSNPLLLPEPDRRIARDLGAGRVVKVSTEMGCDVSLHDSQSGEIEQGAGGGGVEPLAEKMQRFGMGMAHSIHRRMVGGVTSADEARAVLLDPARGETERLRALFWTEELAPAEARAARRSFFDREVIVAAAAIATNSKEPRLRLAVWNHLRGIGDPSLVQPLLQALAKETERDVRYQMVFTLRTFLGQPGVLEALRRIAAEAPEATEHPLLMTVPEAALRASIADADFRGWVRSTLFDDSLPTRWRLLNLRGSVDGRFVTLNDLGKDAADMAFDIGRREQNWPVRALAWTVLRIAPPDETRIPVLLADMADHPDEEVRANAAWVLEQHVDLPQVREAFDKAQDDPSVQVRRRVSDAISKAGSPQ